MALLEDDIVLEGDFSGGHLEGRVVGTSPDGSLVLAGVFDRQGCGRGPFWRRLEGGGFLYGSLDSRGAFSGERNAYLYPDLRTALVGRFRHNRMEEARERRVVGVDDYTGHVMTIAFSADDDGEGAIFSYLPSNLTEIRCPPMQEDPLEKKTVLVAASELEGAGEGLYAACKLRPGDTAAFYNGVRVKPGETPKTRSIHYEIYVDWCNAKGGKVLMTK